jgi:hypothetical protein
MGSDGAAAEGIGIVIVELVLWADPWPFLLIAAINPPYRLDPLQNIININWGEGLAVEFHDKAE